MQTTHSPDSLTQASLAEMASFKGRPCLSLYQPTAGRHSDKQQNPIRFRHLVKTLATSLRHPYAADAVRSLLEPFEALAQDQDFWNHTQDGLAVLGAPGLFRVFLLQQPVAELAVVADSFHTKPLRQWLLSNGRFQVLALSLGRVQLYEGDRNALEGVTLAAGVPQSMAAALDDERTEPHATVSSSGGVSGASGASGVESVGSVGGGRVAMHPDQRGKQDEIGSDAERFFRALDRAVLTHHSRPSGLLLMLAAVPELHQLFREVSHSPFLMAGGLMVDPQGLTLDALRQRAWDVVAPLREVKQAVWRDAYAAAATQGQGSEALPRVAHAAVAGRGATRRVGADC